MHDAWQCMHDMCVRHALPCRVDLGKITLAHPQLPATVCSALSIPPLEALVTEELVPGFQPRRVSAIQVGTSHAALGLRTFKLGA